MGTIRDLLADKSDVSRTATDALSAFSRDLAALTTELFGGGGGGRGGGGRGGGGGTSLQGQIMAISSEASGATPDLPGIMERLRAFQPQIREAVNRVNAFLQTRVPEVNEAIGSAGISFIEAGGALPPPGQ